MGVGSVDEPRALQGVGARCYRGAAVRGAHSGVADPSAHRLGCSSSVLLSL